MSPFPEDLALHGALSANVVGFSRHLRSRGIGVGPAEAAEALGVSRSRCYELIKEGGIPSMRIGTAVRVPRVALEQWVASRVKAHEADGQ